LNRRIGAAALAVVAWTAPGAAHPAADGGERTLVLELDRAPIRVSYRIWVAGAAAERARSAADRDRDGQVDAREANQALDERADELLAALRICSGDAADELRCERLERRDVERVEADGWSKAGPAHLHFGWTLRLRAAPVAIGALRVEDDHVFPGVAVSNVQIEPPQAFPLLAAGAGPEPRGVARQFNWIEANRERGPRVTTALWRPHGRRLWWGALLALAAGLSIGLIAFLRARRGVSGRSA
jgi:hypothetical protein